MKRITTGLVALFVQLFQAVSVSANTACSDGMIRNSYGFMGETVIQSAMMYCGVTSVFTFN